MIYIACPYTGQDTDKYVKIATEYACKLMNDGMPCYSPITYGHELAKIGCTAPHEKWMYIDKTILLQCHTMHVLMCDGWTKSKGVLEEIECAKRNNIFIKYVEV